VNPISIRPARGALILASLTLATSSIAVHAQDESSEPPVMAVDVAGLASGDVVTANRIDFTVQPIGYELVSNAGTPPVDGQGHYHVILDGGLINMFATPDASVSLQNVAPGAHTLMVLPAMNNHMEVMEGAAAIEFDYQPSEPLPEITAATEVASTPTITIESPASGETVSDVFDIVVSTTGLELSEGLLGKPNVDGFGHWHVFVDAAEGMGTMMAMSGTDTITVSTAALSPGPHTFIAVLVDNLHAPFDPPIATKVEVEVAPSGEAAASSGDVVAVSLQEWLLDPPALTLAAGSHTFDAFNDGTIAHAFALEGEGISAATSGASIAVGASESLTVDLAPGTYEIYCPIPGHKEAGMVGTLAVSA
jgi:plastocyanin